MDVVKVVDLIIQVHNVGRTYKDLTDQLEDLVGKGITSPDYTNKLLTTQQVNDCNDLTQLVGNLQMLATQNFVAPSFDFANGPTWLIWYTSKLYDLIKGQIPANLKDRYPDTLPWG